MMNGHWVSDACLERGERKWILCPFSFFFSQHQKEPREKQEQEEKWSFRGWVLTFSPVCPKHYSPPLWSWKRSVFIPIPEKGIAKEYSNYRTIALISHASKVKVDQLCPTLCDPMNYTVHGSLQARIQEWVAFPFSRGSSQPRDKTQISCITGKFFTLSQQSNVQNSPNQASAVREPWDSRCSSWV